METHVDAVHEQASMMIEPGATIGMVGGGQLGRMFAMAAARMGYDVVVLCEHADAPAAQVAHRAIVGSLSDASTVDEFARQCDVITLEFENIPADCIARCSKLAPTYPAASVLATTQNRLLEKSALREAGLPVTPFAAVSDGDSLRAAADSLGWPLIVKTASSGYDGKGQYRLESDADADSIPWQSADGWIAEQCIAFDREISVIVARTADGRCECFPLFENEHRHHILDLTIAPAAVAAPVEAQARKIALAAADALDLVGVLCVEMFVIENTLLINEVAPRPHNSGHLTIEACETSQFEQHVRAICGLSLGSTRMICGVAAMANLLGDLWNDDGSPPNWNPALQTAGVRLHLYGKRQAKRGRKMGHLTATGSRREEVAGRLRSVRKQLGHQL